MNGNIFNWFIPRLSASSQSEHELMRVFVFTHLLGPLIAQPMAIYLYFISPELSLPLIILIVGIFLFGTLPFALKTTGNLKLCAILSFVGLTSASLFGTFFYGNFNSPFLPWLIVSLLLGFMYLGRHVELVIGLFVACILVFVAAAWTFGFPTLVETDLLEPVAWLSIVSASIYMSWMVLYYAQVSAMRRELSAESERFQTTLQELRKAHALCEETSRVRSAFFAKMSHELRTPLNVIIGYSEVLIEDVEDAEGEDSESWSDLQRINKAAGHLLSLVSHVLDEETGEDDEKELDVTTFTLADMVADIEATARPMVEANGNEFRISCEYGRETLTTDRTKVRQILLNLLSNAGKFTERGAIVLTVEAYRVGSDRRIRFLVADTGIGIAEEALGNLFQDYMQADATISGRFGGTGIGLSLVRRLSVLLGGDVTAHSIIGEGSQFTAEIAADVRDLSDVEVEANGMIETKAADTFKIAEIAKAA